MNMREVKKIIWGGAIWAPAALVLGMIVGGYGPNRDLERTQAELEWVREHGQSRSERLSPLMQIVAPSAIPADPVRDGSEPVPGDDAEDRDADEIADYAESEPPPAPPSLEERLETAREVWQVRSDIARNTFVSLAGLDREEANRFDVLMAAMNLRMRNEFEAASAQIAERETFTAEDVTRMVHQLTGALALTYDEMDRAMPPGWRESAGPELDLVDFIDPGVIEPMLEVESQLEELSAQRPRRRRW